VTPSWTISDLGSAHNDATGRAARDFCLRIIRDVYRIDYNSDWHADLDTLAGAAAQAWYRPQTGGGFRIVQDEAGAVIATGGFYDLSRKPGTAGRLKARYGDRRICQIARVYLAPMWRGKGLGSRIVAVLEADARALGYDTAYLHADAQTSATLAFWRSRGYRDFGAFSYPSPAGGTDTSVDFDKRL
jgi:GNAT superfamily N-acetyltransferase